MAEQAVPMSSSATPQAAVPAPGSTAGPAPAPAPSGTRPGARASIDEIIAAQEEIFCERQRESRRLADRAGLALAGGVTSSWQITRPQPVWLSHGKGSKIYDVDGNEYVDLHGGYGAALAGHGHPAIVEALRSQAALGTHFAQPTPAAILVAEELARRFGLPLWRFANSGTEATMDAVHLMRAVTGRDLIIKVEGGYHGHHDSVQVSVCPEADDVGPAHKPTQVPSSTGIPRAIMDLTLVVGFNDLDGVARLLDENPGRIAGMIIEPIMMNAGIIQPEPGYLAGPEGTAALPRRAADLRRGQDRAHRGPRRGDRGDRGDPGHHLPGQGHRRRRVRRGHRRHRGGDGARRLRRLRDGRDVQRQPAGHGGLPGHALRGRHARGLPADRGAPAAGRRRPAAGDRPERPAPRR